MNKGKLNVKRNREKVAQSPDNRKLYFRDRGEFDAPVRKDSELQRNASTKREWRGGERRMMGATFILFMWPISYSRPRYYLAYFLFSRIFLHQDVGVGDIHPRSEGKGKFVTTCWWEVDIIKEAPATRKSMSTWESVIIERYFPFLSTRAVPARQMPA